MSRTQCLIPILFVLMNPREAAAFDPFTATAAIGAVSDAIDTGDSAVDLMKITEVDPDLIKEADANVRRIEELNRQTREAKYLSEDARELASFDLSRSKSLAAKLKEISSRIKQAKQIKSFLSSLGKKSGAQHTEVQVEQVRLNSQILDELRNMRISQFNQYLEDRERQVKFQVAVEKSLREEQEFQSHRLQSNRTRKANL